MPSSKSDKPVPSLTPQITSPDHRRLSQLQQEFNRKVAQIEQLKQELTTRRDSMDLAQKSIEKELRPIIMQQVAQRVALVKLLDAAFALPLFSFREKEKLAQLIVSMALDLIRDYEREDLIALHDRYAEVPYAERALYLTEDEDATETGIAEEEDALPDNWDELDEFERLQAQLDREEEERERARQNRQKGRKTKAQQEKEAKAKAELSNISKASRRVYTDLAKQLHPDKEQDETKRAWKEEAMKRVTQAYHHDDFFELLRLQMEFMQEQGQALDKLPDEQLAYYIKLLDDQLGELQTELNGFIFGPNATFYDRFCGSQKQMNQKFKQAKESLTYELEQLKHNLRVLQDPVQIKVLLK
ncbi:J domain-containing protein [Pontibacter ramchanderi]|uniref:DnaJ-like protein n=1 Tax=Pontibacter ramchanderi TaxID=1179743 RepID=A0A2N3UC30_9BACT|nr:J domain-containing protein [Pontibacter ramchanderi]PKV66916.1 hypothetical protein BD749_2053 [Pontibacter ramchanderi]